MKIARGVEQPLYEITVIHRFTAGHRLRCVEEGWEEAHHHAWRVEATARCRGVDEAGMAMDFRYFKALLEQVLEKLDGRYLNETPPFDKKPPSAENLAHYIFHMLREPLKQHAYLHRIVVWESEDCAAAYIGEDQ